MKIEDVTNFVVDNDVYCDRIPIISTLVNLYYLFQKCVIDIFKIDSSARSFNAEHISHKSYLRCVVLLVPILGNIVVYLYEKLFQPILTPYYPLLAKFNVTESYLLPPAVQESETFKTVYEACLNQASLCAEVTPENVLNVLKLAHKNSKEWLVEACVNYMKNYDLKENLINELEYSLQNDLPSLTNYLFFELWHILLCFYYFEGAKDSRTTMKLSLSNPLKRTIWDFASRHQLGLIKALMDPHIFRKGLNEVHVNYKRIFLDFYYIKTLFINNQLDHILPRNNKWVAFISIKAKILLSFSAQVVKEFFRRAQPFKSLIIQNTYHNNVESEEIKAVKQGLRQMKSLKSLELNEFPTNFFADCIQDLESLESLFLKKYDGDFKALLGMIQQNKPWKKIGIEGGCEWKKTGKTSYQRVVNKLISKDLGEFLNALEDNTTLSKLVLRNHAIEVQGAASLAEFIAKKPQLSVLDLRYNPLKFEGIKRLGLETNTTLREIRLTINHQSELRAILDFIVQNKSLETLVLEIGFFQEEMWDELLQGLAKNNTLKNLEFRLNLNYLNNNSFPIEGKFLVNLIEQVNSLTSIEANFRLNSDDALRLASALGKGKTQLTLTDDSASQVLDHAKETLESRTPTAAARAR